MGLQFGKYTFHCRLETDAILPFYKGSTFRGVFGHALKRVVCALRLRECPECILKDTCLYFSLFENPRADAIHPLVIEPPPEGERAYRAGDRFDCSVVLFGGANDKLPYLVYAFEQMGRIGIGRRMNDGRGRFVLKEVEAGGKAIYSDADRKLIKAETVETLFLSSQERQAGKVQVTLETPLRLKFENRLTAELPFHVLVRAMLRRISSLFNAFGDGEPRLDYSGLVRQAEAVKAAESRIRWFDWERYSNRQNTRMFMGGMIGSVTYEGDLTPYVPLLDIAAKVHIGKQTTFGMGKLSWEMHQAGPEM